MVCSGWKFRTVFADDMNTNDRNGRTKRFSDNMIENHNFNIYLKMYPRLRSNFIWLYFPKYSANMAEISLGTRLFATLPLRYAVWFSKTSETRVNCEFY